MDGVDVALIGTDGKGRVKAEGFATFSYTPAFRRRLQAALGKRKSPAVERELTDLHIRAVKAFLRKKKIPASSVDVIGFHGHTLFHAPHEKVTVQIGDGIRLARQTGIPVIWDFRSEDVKAGGQGAPLVPVYHQALAAKWKKPIVFLNIGGVANITYVGPGGVLLACDTGPGNALMDDWALRHTGRAFDKNGRLAAKGQIDAAWVKLFLRHSYFKKKAPKSLDRDAFKGFVPDHLKAADGMATLAQMTVESIAKALRQLPQTPREMIVCGGGRKNAHLMQALAAATGIKTMPIETKKWNGDATEAEAFAYMAVRLALGLPISFKGTTGRKKGP